MARLVKPRDGKVGQAQGWQGWSSLGLAHATGANLVEGFWDECCNIKR